MNVTIICNDCGAPATVNCKLKRGTVKLECECDERREIVPKYNELVRIGHDKDE